VAFNFGSGVLTSCLTLDLASIVTCLNVTFTLALMAAPHLAKAMEHLEIAETKAVEFQDALDGCVVTCGCTI